MPNLNKDALDIWNALRPMIDKEIERRTQGMVQRRKAKVTTAPSLATKKIGVTEPFGDQYFIPFNTNLSTAKVGDVVWVEFMYGAANAFASMYAAADTKDFTVGGVLDVVNRRCSATISSAGWYRVCKTANVSGSILKFYINTVNVAETHEIDFMVSGTATNFTNESSVCTHVFIDKIRSTYNGADLFIDVHYNTSNGNTVKVGFEAYGKASETDVTLSSGLTSVADSPSGETVVTTHDFQQNNALWTTGTIDTWTKEGWTGTADGRLSYSYNSDHSILQLNGLMAFSVASRTGANPGISFSLPFAYNGPTQEVRCGTQSMYTKEALWLQLTNGSATAEIRTTETYDNVAAGTLRFIVPLLTIYMN